MIINQQNYLKLQVKYYIEIINDMENQFAEMIKTAVIAERIQYGQFRAVNYKIGSGSVEDACKQIVTERLKLSGAQWLVDGAVQTAKARSAWLSGHWYSSCERRSRLPLAI